MAATATRTVTSADGALARSLAYRLLSQAFAYPMPPEVARLRDEDLPLALASAEGLEAPVRAGLEALAEALVRLAPAGVLYRACSFLPTFHKHARTPCGGVQLHVIDRETFAPYRTGLAVLTAVRQLWPEALQWRTDAYEFRRDVLAIDLLTGSPAVREAIDRGAAFDEIVERAGRGVEGFTAARERALLY